MTSATKRKYVVKEMLDNFDIPGPDQQIVKVTGNPGSNLHEVATKDGEKILCSLPLKFRKNIWIKRGNFVVIEPIKEGDRVRAEIVRILYPQHVKSLQKDGVWPKEFENNNNNSTLRRTEEMLQNTKLTDHRIDIKEAKSGGEADVNNSSDEECYSSEDDLADIPMNTNRRPVSSAEETSSDSDEDDW